MYGTTILCLKVYPATLYLICWKIGISSYNFITGGGIGQGSPEMLERLEMSMYMHPY